MSSRTITKSGLFGKYRFLVISIAFFLVFDLGVLALNFYTSGKIAEKTERINLAGHQRTLSQRLSKSTLYIKSQKFLQWPYQSGLDELRKDYSSFRQTLNAFSEGGQVKSIQSNDYINIPAVENEVGKKLVEEANQLWAGFENVIQPLMTDVLITDEEIEPASIFIAQNNTDLFNVMNDLTNHFKQESDEQTSFLRLVQVVGISLATINFFVILFHFIRQLRRRDNKLQSAQNEATQILNTIDEGVFLVNEDLIIGDQHSKSLEKEFSNNNISGEKFVVFMQQYFSKSSVETAVEYISLYFAKHINTDLIADINPLDKVKASIVNSDGVANEKYFNFSFAALNQNKNEKKAVLVSVKNVSDAVKLDKQNLESEFKAEKQIALLAEILPIPPQVLTEFINSARQSCIDINSKLKKSQYQHEDYPELIKDIYLKSHSVKGTSVMLGIDLITDQMHEFESVLEGLTQQHSKLQGRHFVPLILALKKVLNSLDTLHALKIKLTSYSENVKPVEKKILPVNQKSRWAVMAKSVENQTKKMGLNLKIQLNGIEGISNNSIEQPLFELSSQLIRNSLAHSFDPDLVNQNELERGDCQISLALDHEDNNCRFTFTENGRGFNFELIRGRLIKNNLVIEDHAKELTRQELVYWTFKDEFSTRDNVSKIAGRGVGMSVVKDNIRKLGGTLKMRLIEGKLTQFIVDFPLCESESLANSEVA